MNIRYPLYEGVYRILTLQQTLVRSNIRFWHRAAYWKNRMVGKIIIWEIGANNRKQIKRGKKKDKTRRDKLAGYFFNLSQLTFVALVLGGVTPLYTNIEVGINWYILVAGITLTIILANIGNLILK